jgi:hypothetical protein
VLAATIARGFLRQAKNWRGSFRRTSSGTALSWVRHKKEKLKKWHGKTGGFLFFCGNVVCSFFFFLQQAEPTAAEILLVAGFFFTFFLPF